MRVWRSWGGYNDPAGRRGLIGTAAARLAPIARGLRAHGIRYEFHWGPVTDKKLPAGYTSLGLTLAEV